MKLPTWFRLAGVVVLTSVAIGAAVAVFLWALQQMTHLRFHRPWLLYGLPVAGVVIHYVYHYFGKSAERGNNLIIDEIHEPGAGVPAQMGHLVFFGTLITHAFGGSAGREGTAVQIGGSIADQFNRWFGLENSQRRLLLTTGIAAGFGAVFGTPAAGAIFAVEVLTRRKLYYDLLPACALAAFTGDLVVKLIGVKHTHYHILPDDVTGGIGNYLKFDMLTLAKTLPAAIAFGVLALIFAWSVHRLKALFVKSVRIMPLIPVIGGLIVIALVYLNGRPDYLGLGVDAQFPGAVTIPSAFTAGGALPFSWLWKLVYTVVTLASGFKGGEVTPLFYIGATAGNAMATLLHAPVSLFAALGFISIFAGATKTPLASAVMGIELFGGQYAVFFFVACAIAVLASGKAGIYSAQRS